MVYFPEGKMLDLFELYWLDISPFINNGVVDVDVDFKIRTNIYDIEKNEMGEYILLSKIIKGSVLNENKR